MGTGQDRSCDPWMDLQSGLLPTVPRGPACDEYCLFECLEYGKCGFIYKSLNLYSQTLPWYFKVKLNMIVVILRYLARVLTLNDLDI